MRRRSQRCLLLLITSVASLAPLAASAENKLLDTKFGIKKVAGDCKFTEGPTLSPTGDLFFSDGANDRIMRLAADGKVVEFRKPCGRANGLMFDPEGRLVICQSSGNGGGRRVTRIELDGTETVLAEEFDGRKFLGPNDLAIDDQGRIYFTDPDYENRADAVPAVYRIDGPGKVTEVLRMARPNGIAITPDNRTLYVSDRSTQKLHRFRLTDEGALKPNGIVYDFSPDRGIDGMCLDRDGNIWGAAGEGKTTGLFIVSPTGKLLLHQQMPEYATNVEFGGKDLRDLYMTCGQSVYQLRTNIPGAAPRGTKP